MLPAALPPDKAGCARAHRAERPSQRRTIDRGKKRESGETCAGPGIGAPIGVELACGQFWQAIAASDNHMRSLRGTKTLGGGSWRAKNLDSNWDAGRGLCPPV